LTFVGHNFCGDIDQRPQLVSHQFPGALSPVKKHQVM
jgi:hypothetical protein